jgi:hypothetical protein
VAPLRRTVPTLSGLMTDAGVPPYVLTVQRVRLTWPPVAWMHREQQAGEPYQQRLL